MDKFTSKEICVKKPIYIPEDFDEAIKLFCISLGLCREGDSNFEAAKILKILVINKRPLSIFEISKQVDISEAAVRYHIRKMKEIGLVNGSREYTISEDSLEKYVLFLEKFYIPEILEKVKDLGKKIDELVEK